MKNNRKIDADKGLAVEQFPDLNKKFYENFMDDYYLIKLDNLLNIITRTSEYQRSIERVEIELGKLKCHLGGDNNEDLQKYAKLELATTYFHCLETFIRLFVAHATLSPCPWIEISRLTISDYRKALYGLSKGKFNGFNNKLDDDSTVLFVLTGYDALPEGIEKKDLEGLKRWIEWAANELLNNYEYNSFKHGLAVYTNINGFKFMDKEKIKLQKHGECIEFISKNEKMDRYVWVRKTVFISYDSRAAIIFTFGKLIKNILNIGKFVYAKGEYKIDWIPNHEYTPEFIFNDHEEAIPGIPVEVKGFRRELLYYEDKPENS